MKEGIYMSVIFAVPSQDNKKIYLAGDKRACNIDGSVASEETQKVFYVNDHLAYACAGNMSISTMLSLKIKELDAEALFTDDIERILTDFYALALKKECMDIFMYPVCVIAVGLNKDKKTDIRLYVHNNGKESKGSQPMALFQPTDLDNKCCAEIVLRNRKLYKKDFVKFAIKEIAQKSSWVNDKYNLWIFDTKNGIGKFY